MTVFLAVCIFFSAGGRIIIPARLILLSAFAFRLVFLFSEPVFSDDIFRYAFDGKMLVSGFSPYAVPPSTAALVHPETALSALKVNHPDLVTVYPPAAQLIFASGVLINGICGIKFLLIIMDVTTCFMISKILGIIEKPQELAILYAWNPLPLLETAGSGHIDAAGIFFFFISLSFFLKTGSASQAFSEKKENFQKGIYSVLSGISMAAAVLVKLFPAVFLPFLFFLFKPANRIKFLAGFFSAFFCLVFPFLPDIGNALKTFEIYALNWEFSGFIFRFLRDLTGYGSFSRIILILVFFVLAIFICCFSVYSMSRQENYKIRLMTVLYACYGICFTYLVLTPTLHPWYVLYLAAFLPFVPNPAGICFSWSVLLSYRVLIFYTATGVWSENTLTAFMVFVAPVSSLLISSLFSGSPVCRSDQKSDLMP